MIVKELTGLTLKAALKKAQMQVAKVKKTELLAGIGDLVDAKQKSWVKEKLPEELIFLLKLYQQ